MSYSDGDLIVFRAGNDTYEMQVHGDQEAGQGHVRLRDPWVNGNGKSFLIPEEHVVMHQLQIDDAAG